MNKKETIEQISKLSQVAAADCEKVLNALEIVLGQKLSKKKGFRYSFNLLYKIMEKLKDKMVIILFFTLISTAVHGQISLTQKIGGVVTDRLSGKQLAAVSIRVMEKPDLVAVTSDKGEFVFTNLPVGRYTVQAYCLGYELTVIKEIMLTSQKEVALEIAMDPTHYTLNDVVVVANKERASNKMALTGGRLLRIEEVNRYAGGMDDPARLVSSFAGVSTSLGNNGVSVHGNAPSMLQWKLEGIEIPNPNHFADIATLGGGILTSLSTNVLANSDFYNSAFPAEYNNAVSGVFDLKLRTGNNRKHEHTFQAGLLGLDFASEGPLSRNNDDSYLINYRYSTTGLMSKLSAGETNGQLLDYQDLNFKLNFPSKHKGTFSMWGNALVDRFRTKKEPESSRKYTDDHKSSKTDQMSAAAGITHRYFFENGGVLRTTLATTYSNNKATEDIFSDSTEMPYLNLRNRYTNLILTSSFDKKYAEKHSNKTGFTVTNMYYNTLLDRSPFVGKPLQAISEGKGTTTLLSAYSSSLIEFNKKIYITLGLNAQLLTLNNHWTVEPRAAIRWSSGPKSSIAMAYGLHSRMEKMDVYLVRDKANGQPLNKDVDFTKAHHLSLSYQYKVSDNMRIKLEPFYQYLFHVPVIADSSYSILNRNLFYVEDALVNRGKGQHVGLDITIERYLQKGVYYMLTATLFDAKFAGGDAIWHNGKFNRRFIINGLTGKEWFMNKQQRDLLSVNVKLTLQGGERYAPVLEKSSLNHPDKEIQYEEKNTFAKQFSPMFIANYSISYRLNRLNRSHEIAIKWLNVTGAKEYYGHQYNLKTGIIEPKKQATSLFNILYRMDF